MSRRTPHPEPSGSRRDRAAAARAQAARAERRRTRGRLVAGAAAVVVAAGLVAAAVVHRGGPASSATPSLPHPPTATGAVAPPWPAPTSPEAGVTRAGLRISAMEGTALHFHTHLDVLVNGKPVAVPADLGIDVAQQRLAELHTHDTSGVLHVEAPDTTRRYVLGQLFNEWDVRLDATHLGGLAPSATSTLTAYVDGKKVGGDPAAIELKPHREIALVYGPATAKVTVPAHYDFPAGL
jgi:hypothetical protein